MIVETIKPFGPGVKYYDWDAHAESFKLPKEDLVGLMAFSCTEDKPFYDLTFAVAIMTMDDPQIARATGLADAFFARLAARRTFPIYAADGSVMELSAVCFDGTSVGPIGRVDARPAVEITVTARVTPYERMTPA